MIKNNKDKMISFQMEWTENSKTKCFKENEWTTRQIFDAFNVVENDPIETSGQYIATIIIMQKCDSVINIFKDCLDKIRKDHLIITDHYNKDQKESFKANRWDQSIMSVARKIHGSIVMRDETYHRNFHSDAASKIPFLATRYRYR